MDVHSKQFTKDFIETYFRTINTGNEAAHVALYDPKVTFFGSVSGLEDSGLATIRAIFRTALSTYGVRGVVPRKTFGLWPEFAVVVEFLGGSDPEPKVLSDGVWYMVLNEAGKVRKVSLLWDGAPFLKMLKM